MLIKLWDTRTGKVLFTINKHDGKYEVNRLSLIYKSHILYDRNCFNQW